MTVELHCREIADLPDFTRDVAHALADGREVAMYLRDDDGHEALSYAVRHERGAFRIRNADLQDIGAFSSVEAAMRFGSRNGRGT